MALTITGDIADILANNSQAGSVVIDGWTIGIDFKANLYVLNLYSQGVNYPEIITDSALAGIVSLLNSARTLHLPVNYWPNGTYSVLHVGRFPTA